MERKLFDLGFIGQPFVILSRCSDGSMADTVTVVTSTGRVELSVDTVLRVAAALEKEYGT